MERLSVVRRGESNGAEIREQLGQTKGMWRGRRGKYETGDRVTVYVKVRQEGEGYVIRRTENGKSGKNVAYWQGVKEKKTEKFKSHKYTIEMYTSKEKRSREKMS